MEIQQTSIRYNEVVFLKSVCVCDNGRRSVGSDREGYGYGTNVLERCWYIVGHPRNRQERKVCSVLRQENVTKRSLASMK